MRDGGYFTVIDGEGAPESMTGGFGHHDHVIRPGSQLLENRTLVSRRVFQNCVRDYDGGHTQAVDNVYDLVSIQTAVDAVLVLDHSHIILVEQLGACCHGCR